MNQLNAQARTWHSIAARDRRDQQSPAGTHATPIS